MTKRRNRSSNSKHRIVPVWKDSFDQEAFARALLLLAMHLDETDQKAHTSENAQQAAEQGGGGHE